MEDAYSKEAILSRFYNHAASFWGIKNIDDLDPLVRLLMEALASEIYHVNHAIEDSNVRILESLASVLTPSVLIAPRPAHSIIQANPIEPYLYLDKYTVFSDKNIPQDMRKQGLDSISLAPVTNVRLVSGKIKYLVCERMFYRIEENNDKRLLGHAHTLNEKVNQTLWIGMDVDKDVKSLKDIPFYFDFFFTNNKYEKYSLLPYSKWKTGNQILEISSGLPVWEDKDSQNSKIPSIFSTYDLQNQTDKSVLDLYSQQFLTINSDVRFSDLEKKSFPDEIKAMFPDNLVSKAEPCYWIKVTFPPYILATDIHNINIYLNTIPVANKIFYSHVYTPNTLTSIMPMQIGEWEYFLAVEKVIDSHNREYHSIPYSTDINNESGVYTIKQGGVERFDTRDVKEYIERLTDLLRDEVSAFTSMDKDNMRNIVNNLKKGLNDVETKFKNNRMNGMETSRYLLLNATNTRDTIFLDYWATNCEHANGLPSGRTLVPQKSIPVVKDSCRLLKKTMGGKSAPNVTGRLDAFRYVISSRDQIFTHEDIANFCKYELGEKINRVEVKQGVAVSPKPKEGLKRTIDVHLTPTPGYSEIINEMQIELLTKLHLKSPDSFYYRIIIK